jgi:hypothetical protein
VLRASISSVCRLISALLISLDELVTFATLDDVAPVPRLLSKRFSRYGRLGLAEQLKSAMARDHHDSSWHKLMLRGE